MVSNSVSEAGAPRRNGTSAMRSVLLVDDEPDVLASYTRLLEERVSGIRVHSCASAEEALQILREQAIDLIVADYLMPGMDGMTFLREAKRLRPNVPRFVFTANSREALARQVDHDGVISLFLSKGASPDPMVELVAISLGRPLRRPGAEAV